MSFTDAVRSALTKYATFSGRARRSEYWFFTLAYLIASVVANILDQVIGSQLFVYILALALFLPSLAVGIRRLHDTGRSGWWLLLGLVPIVGFIVLIVFYVQDSQPATNAYGPSPKHGPVIEGDVSVAPAV